MRIATVGIHTQAALSKMQQVTSGKRVITPADDPVGAVHLQKHDQSLRCNVDTASRLWSMQ